jgi:hypothetical protein
MRSTPENAIRCARVAALLVGVAAASVSCGEVARTGRASSYVIIDRVEGASGAEPGSFGTTVLSDVQTLVEATVGGQSVRTPTVYNDLGRATFRFGLKNPGTAASPVAPTTLNEITLTRYRVAFRRSDGRNTPGVDVPYAFDGAFTLTIPAAGSAQGSFDLVRHQSKLEPPLRNLIGGGGALFISTIAEITFWGRDQAGNDVEATGTLSVTFGDFADPR